MAEAAIYTAKMGQPPVPDEGPTTPPKPKKRAGQADIYTADMGQPPVPDEGPTKNTRKVKKMAMGGSASSRADGCAVKGKTKGRFV
jgi:hypothetical protein